MSLIVFVIFWHPKVVSSKKRLVAQWTSTSWLSTSPNVICTRLGERASGFRDLWIPYCHVLFVFHWVHELLINKYMQNLYRSDKVDNTGIFYFLSKVSTGFPWAHEFENIFKVIKSFKSGILTWMFLNFLQRSCICECNHSFTRKCLTLGFSISEEELKSVHPFNM